MSSIKYIKLIFIFAFLSIIQSAFSQAQYVGEFGLRGGISYYNGDVNSTTVFRYNKPAAGAFLRFKLNDYWGIKIDGGFAGVKGSGKNFPKNHLPASKEIDGSGSYSYQFDKRIVSLDALAVLDFFKFDYSRHDHDAKWHTPYAMLGPTMAVMTEWSGKECRGGLAFGVGYKFKLAERVNAGVEWTMHKLFRDDLDRNGANKYLDDPYGMGHIAFKNNDYYSMCLLFVSVDIFKRKGACHYYRK